MKSWNKAEFDERSKINSYIWIYYVVSSASSMCWLPVRSIPGTYQVRRPCTWRVSAGTPSVWKSCWRRARLRLTSKTATDRHPCTWPPNSIVPPSSRCRWSQVMLFFLSSLGWIVLMPYFLHPVDHLKIPGNMIFFSFSTGHPSILSIFRSCAHVCALGWMSWTMMGRHRCTWPAVWGALSLSELCWRVEPSVISLVVLATPFTALWSTVRSCKCISRWVWWFTTWPKYTDDQFHTLFASV